MAAGHVTTAVPTVVVADDYPVVVSGLRAMLTGSRLFEVVAGAYSGAEAMLRCEQHRPDLLILDLRLPDMPAATICRRVRERRPETAIVVLTAHPEEQALRACMRAGASGCILKDASEQTLLSSLVQVSRGRTVIDPRVAGGVVRRSHGAGLLSERELEVLGLLARGLTVPEIAEHLGVSQNTIKSHTRSMFAKFEVHNRVQALAVAREHGLL
jgi:two-component system, NarL family, nitrate/nitrite response regulator NarL